jgi:hypothetical protein
MPCTVEKMVWLDILNIEAVWFEILCDTNHGVIIGHDIFVFVNLWC